MWKHDYRNSMAVVESPCIESPYNGIQKARRKRKRVSRQREAVTDVVGMLPTTLKKASTTEVLAFLFSGHLERCHLSLFSVFVFSAGQRRLQPLEGRVPMARERFQHESSPE